MTMTTDIATYLAEGCGRCELGGTPACKVHRWKEHLLLLRSIVLDCDLAETMKWGVPCYTLQQKNIVNIYAFKDSCALSFFKGALLNDAQGILTKPGENSQATRQIRFSDVQDIIRLEAELKTYIYEAIELEKAGIKINFKDTPEPMAEELQAALENDAELSSAFYALTPGRQRGYNLYFSAPKQSKTRLSRIEKYTPKILCGKGFHDR